MAIRRILMLAVFLLAAEATTRADSNGRVPIRDEWKACAADEDCTDVDVRCDECCGLEAIAKKSVADFKHARKAQCADWNGGYCDCTFGPHENKCIQKVCTLVRTKAPSRTK